MPELASFFSALLRRAIHLLVHCCPCCPQTLTNKENIREWNFNEKMKWYDLTEFNGFMYGRVVIDPLEELPEEELVSEDEFISMMVSDTLQG